MASKQFPWYRMYCEARTDAKLRALTGDQFRVWFNLLCLAAEQEESRGIICDYDDDLLAIEVSDGDIALLQATLERLVKFRIVRHNEDEIEFINFDKRQYDKPSNKPERVAERVAAHRARKRNADVTPSNADVTPSNNPEEERERDLSSSSEEDSVGADTPTPSLAETPREQAPKSRKRSAPEPLPLDSDAVKLTAALRDAILSRWPNNRDALAAHKEAKLQNWAVPIDHMLRLDRGRTVPKVRSVIAWLPTNEFWSETVLSPGNFRKNFDRLEIAMKRDEERGARNGTGTTRTAAPAGDRRGRREIIADDAVWEQAAAEADKVRQWQQRNGIGVFAHQQTT